MSGFIHNDTLKIEKLLVLQRDLGIALSSTVNMADALNLILEAVMDIDGIDYGWINLINNFTGEYELAVHRGLSREILESMSVLHKKLLWGHIDKHSGMTITHIPVSYNKQILTVISAGSYSDDELSSHSLKALQTIAAQIGGVMSRLLMEQRVKYRLEVDQAIKFAGSTFYNPQEADLNKTLAVIGKAVLADRVYIFKIKDQGNIMDNTYEWCAPGIKAQINILQNLRTDTFPWWIKKLKNDENIVIKNINELPAEAENEKCILKKQNIKSLLVVPVKAIDKKLLGFVGFDNTHSYRQWFKEDIEAIEMFGQLLGFYWQHLHEREILQEKTTELIKAYDTLQAMNEELQANYNQLEAMNVALEESQNDLLDLNTKLADERDRLELTVKASNFALWDWHVPSGNLYFNDRFNEMLGFKAGELDYKIDEWSGRLHPEDKEPVLTELLLFKSGELNYYEKEYRLQTRKGYYIWIKAFGKVVAVDKEGNALRAVGLQHDITERIQSEEKLMNSYKKLEMALNQTVSVLSATMARRDPYTSEHQSRVAYLASCIAREINDDDQYVKSMYITGMLHDIGKIYVPAEILSKPGQLNELEMGMIKAHPQVGYEILKSVEFQLPVAEIILQHHERFDGSGYPKGLRGEEISLEARILAVADVVEAIASHRPYRESMGLDLALQEIKHNAGVLYDPRIVDICVRLFEEGKFSFNEYRQISR